jgi:membrane protein DedA with SNARE-associated domain
VSGELVLIPAIYLVYTGQMDLYTTFLITILATFLSDSVWYFVGRLLPHERIIKIKAFKRNEKMYEAVAKHFHKHSFRIVFYSKFVYGTRLVTQIVAGMRKLPFFKYSAINVLGIITYNITLFAIGITFGKTSATWGNNLHSVELAIALVVICIIMLHIWIRRRLIKV